MTGKVKGPQYDAEFRELLHQFEMCSQSIAGFVGLERFMAQFSLEHCQSAKMRIAAGKSNYKGEETDKNLAQRVFDITTKFIQPIDVLTLGITSVDEIAPPVRDVHQALLNYPQLPAGYQGLALVEKWVAALNSKSATDELSEDEVRQLKYDLELAIQQFNDVVLKRH